MFSCQTVNKDMMLHCHTLHVKLKTHRTHVDWKPQNPLPSLKKPVSSLSSFVCCHAHSSAGDLRAAICIHSPFVSRKVLSGWRVFRSLNRPPLAAWRGQSHALKRGSAEDSLPLWRRCDWLTRCESGAPAPQVFFIIGRAGRPRSCKHLKSRCFTFAGCTITSLHRLNDFLSFLFLIPTLWSHNGSVSCSETPPVSLISHVSPSVRCHRLGSLS